MKKGIFYIARPISGEVAIRMLTHIKVLETDTDVIDHLSTTKTDKAKKTMEEYSNLKINKSVNLFGERYNSHYKNMSSWMEVYNNLNVSELEDYDSLYIMGGINFLNSGFNRYGKRRGVFPHDRGQIKFISQGTHFINVLAMLKAHKEYGIPLHEYSYDTNELPCSLFHSDVAPGDNYYTYYGHAIAKYDPPVFRLDCHQYYLQQKTENSLFGRPEKIFDMTSGYTNVSDTRNTYSEELDELASRCKLTNIYISDNVKKINTFLGIDEYNEKLLQSKFTFVFPAYDRHVVSIDRIIGSLHRDCLTLFHSDCNLKDIQESYDVDLSELITTVPFPDEKRIDLLHHLKERILTYKEGFR